MSYFTAMVKLSQYCLTTTYLLGTHNLRYKKDFTLLVALELRS